MAAAITPKTTTTTTTEYKGPLPYLPEKATPELIQKGNFRLERVAEDQHPRWNTDCLLKQEELHEGKRTILDGTGGRNNIKRDRQFGKRDNLASNNNNYNNRKRMRAERRAVNSTFPKVSIAAVNSTDMRCNGRSDICDLRYNQVTYPGTHNSAAYDLQYDCDLSTQTCLETKTIVMCHGFGAQRAVGITLDSVLSQVQQFMLANPYEVLTIEFNEYDGDATPMAKFIVDKVLQYFTLPSGQSMLWPRKSLSEGWPTLRNMILADQRIMIFMSGTYWAIPDPKPEWANQKDTWKQDAFAYTNQDTTPAQLNQTYYDYCDKGPVNDGSYILWQQIDINMAILEEDIISSLKQGKIPQICIGPLAKQTNSGLMEALSEYCYTRWPYWFRVRVNDYWEGSIFKVVNHFNDMNVARVKSGDSITPF
ncbi:hypothetical protein BGZ76_001792 [Entomortierella beljakovae]|nr:hypothetical protein BGZ76_001792 [Entomortierella beljakovae]